MSEFYMWHSQIHRHLQNINTNRKIFCESLWISYGIILKENRQNFVKIFHVFLMRGVIEEEPYDFL